MSTVQYPPAAAGAGGVAIQGSGTAVVSNSTVQFANSNGLTFGLNGSTVTASHNGLTAETQVFVGALAAVGSTATSGTVSFSNSPTISFGMNGQTVTASAAAAPNMSFWENFHAPTGAIMQVASLNTPWFFPLTEINPVPGAITIDSIGLGVSGATNTSSVPAHTISLSVGLYKLNNSTQLTMINSFSLSTGTAASVDSAFLSWYAGVRHITMVSSRWSAQPVLTAGGSYWMGIAAATAGSSLALSFMGGGYNAPQNFSGEVGSSFTTRPMYPFFGAYSAVSAGLPAAVSVGEVVNAVQYGNKPYVAVAQGISWLP